ncbi:hypothetical protein BJ742DRAFT_741530 [Cladochytrium replicatum]|nr:hypothetical protein BJ742DRAFT_741530 [Cladochytrium replicatum]
MSYRPRNSEQRQLPEQRKFAEELHMLKSRIPVINSPVIDPYQRQFEEETRQIENQIYEQHKKIERELNNPKIGPGFQTMPDDEGRSMKLKPAQNTTIQQVMQRNPQNMFSLTSRLKFTVIFQTGALKAKKIQIVKTKIVGCGCKGDIFVTPQRLIAGELTKQFNDLPSKGSRELYNISVNANPIATGDFLPQRGVKPTPEQIQLGAPVFTFSGELKEDKYLVMRYPNSRGQQYYGEALGRFREEKREGQGFV